VPHGVLHPRHTIIDDKIIIIIIIIVWMRSEAVGEASGRCAQGEGKNFLEGGRV
jgi:hypothetical protein